MRRYVLNSFLLMLTFALIGLVTLGLMLATLDPNEYKDDIAAMVSKNTGRNIIFDGELQATVFPALGFKTGRIRIMDEPVYGGEPFLIADRTFFKFRLVPFLRGRIEVFEVQVDGLSLNLVKTTTGQANWMHGLEKLEAQEQVREGVVALESNLPEPPAPLKGREFLFTNAALFCSNVTVDYKDLGADAAYRATIDSLDIPYASMVSGAPFQASGALTHVTTGMNGKFSFSGMFTIPSEGFYSLDVRSFVFESGSATTAPSDLPAAPNTQNATTNGTRAEQGPQLKLEVQALVEMNTKIDTVAIKEIRGSLQGAPFQGEFLFLTAGNLGFRPGVTFQGNGTMQFDRVDMDEVVDSLWRSRPSNATPFSWQAFLASGQAPVQKNRWSDFATSDLDITLAAKQLTVGKVPLTSAVFSFSVLKDTVRFIQQASVGSGVVESFFVTSTKGKSPKTQFRQVLTNVPAEDLFAGFTSDAVGVTGLVNSRIELQGQGSYWHELAPSFRGKATFSLQKAEFTGVPVIPELLPGVGVLPSSFTVERLSGSFAVNKGQAVSKDIVFQSSVLTGKGAGTVSLPTVDVAMDLNLMLENKPPVIPIYALGKLGNVIYGVDRDMFVKNLSDTILGTASGKKMRTPVERKPARKASVQSDKKTAAQPAKKSAAQPAKKTTAQPAKKTAAQPAKKSAAQPAKKPTTKAPAKKPAAKPAQKAKPQSARR